MLTAPNKSHSKDTERLNSAAAGIVEGHVRRHIGDLLFSALEGDWEILPASLGEAEGLVCRKRGDLSKTFFLTKKDGTYELPHLLLSILENEKEAA